ncbi:MAG: GntR family transcriptional regulator [Planctomycetota bacterium]
MPEHASNNLPDIIYADVRSELSQTGAYDGKLTLTALAQRYDVSLSPVRAAVDRLIAEGYLEKSKTKRLQVAERIPKNRRGETTSNATLLVDREARIREDIIRLSLGGHTGFLRERTLTEKHPLGRTALRSILGHLTVQGLLEKVPRRGFRVRSFDKHDLCSFLEVREDLESRALQLASNRIDNEQLEVFLAANRSPKLNPTAPLSNELHDYWIELSNNAYIQSFFRREAVYYRTLFDFATPNAHLVKQMAAQHCEILEALIAKKWKTADKALRNHIRAQKPIVKSLLKKIEANKTTP